MQKYLTTLYQSTALVPSAHIGMCYSSLTRTNSRKSLLSLSLRVGRSAIVIRHCPSVPVHRMLRHTLTLMCVYPICIEQGLFSNLDVDTLRASFLTNNSQVREMLETCRILPLHVLMEYTLHAMAIIKQFCPLHRISLDYSPDSLTFLLNLHQRFIVSYYLSLNHQTGVYEPDVVLCQMASLQTKI